MNAYELLEVNVPYELLEVKRDVYLMFSHTYMLRTMHETDNTVSTTNKHTRSVSG